MSLKKTTRAKAPAASKKSADSASVKRPMWSQSQMAGAGVVAAAIIITIAAIAIGAHETVTGSEAVTSEVAAPAVTAQSSSKKAPVVQASSVESGVTVTTATESTPVKTSGAKAVAATVAGCLQRSDETFKLTDADGVDVPKARSWKTGFLKKGAATLEVVDPGNHAKLANHVGRRVSVTGMLTDRQMQVRSVRRISATCD